MNMRDLATKLAAVPEQAIDALSSLPANPWRPQRSWGAGQSIAAFGLGLVAGVAIGMLFYVGPFSDEGEDAHNDGDPME